VVVEASKGVPAGQPEITGSIEFYAESVLLAKGETYLVYASVDEKGARGKSCTRTRRASRPHPEVRELRRCK
jgi:hypothetical protein